ncbi:MliC family protein [Wenxinia marina]|uniref:Uncharacterized protein conserved in bacteria, putative lipoprotein n=1 Tax=Wenxinia marina DSM 24838 TaxID=1123501 RepID=A0A0D0QIN6_9RHOB|nr:MliC family protein [Wenxinia marina]KIQ70928.1 Uncharacterized protein conserved in bacteria, putative lipoprotein [Wenxinia marina DSM 24838]GGL56248.1 hypothetical protein GCM10011392_08330 [Wenxinia marina]
MKTLLAALSTLVPAALAAEECAAPIGVVAEAICGDPDLQALTDRVAARFDAALDVTRGLGAGAEAAEAELRTLQSGWERGLRTCRTAPAPGACIEASALRRENELVTQYLLDVPETIATYACDGAAEITAYFFDTPLPSVRLEYGDRLDTGSLVPAGSGARYEASFGTYLWIRGEEATASMELGGQGPYLDCRLAQRIAGF